MANALAIMPILTLAWDLNSVEDWGTLSNTSMATQAHTGAPCASTMTATQRPIRLTRLSLVRYHD